MCALALLARHLQFCGARFASLPVVIAAAAAEGRRFALALIYDEVCRKEWAERATRGRALSCYAAVALASLSCVRRPGFRRKFGMSGARSGDLAQSPHPVRCGGTGQDFFGHGVVTPWLANVSLYLLGQERTRKRRRTTGTRAIVEAGLSALHGALLRFAATCQAKPREKVRARSTGALERALGPKGTVRASTVAIGTERSRATGTGVGDSTPRSGKSLSCAPQQMHVRLHLGCATLVGPN